MMNINKRLLGFFLLIALGISGQSVLANTAANSTIVSNVTLSFDQGADETAFALVTVNLVAAAPTFAGTAVDPATIDEDGSAVVTYTVYSNANGPDTYDITVFPSPVCDNLANDGLTCSDFYSDNLLTSELALSTSTLELGATTVFSTTAFDDCIHTTVAGAECLATVPNDDDTGLSATSVNGLISGDTVFLEAGIECLVDITTDNSATTDELSPAGATSVIEIYSCDGAGLTTVPALGTVIGESKSFTLTLDPDAATPILGLPATQTIDVQTNIESNTTPAGTAIQSVARVFTVEVVAALTINKFVKNITNTGATYNVTCGPASSALVAVAAALPAADNITATNLGTQNSGSADSNPFCESGAVTADPGDTLEYLIVINNGDGSTTSTVIMQEPIADFTLFGTDGNEATAENLVVFTADNAIAWTGTTDATADDPVEFDTGTRSLYFYPGGTSDGNATFGDVDDGGTLTGDDYYLLIYTVTVQ
ncbi:MAG: hypothetical protein P8R02_06355 [Pseudomonadales bacterium]|nr:hypothetical protein [Pseudomonadales bacterium]